jgi:hypothetical protein
MIRQKKITVKTFIEVLKQKDPQERHEKLLDVCVEYGESDHGRKTGTVKFKSLRNQEEPRELLRREH